MPTMYPLYALQCLLPSGLILDFQFYDHYVIIVAYILLYYLCSTPLIFCSYLIIP